MGWLLLSAPVLGAAFTIWMAVDSVRRGRAQWLVLILCTGPIGAAIYFACEVHRSGRDVAFRPHRVSQGELLRAEADLHRVDNASAWTDYAAALRARGRHADAVTAAQRALERDPQELHARYELGRALLAGGRPAEAAVELAQVTAREPDHDYGDALLALGKAREAAGDLEGARAAYAGLAERSTRPEVLYHLALLHHRLGDDAGCAAALERLVAENQYGPEFSRRRSRPFVRRAQKWLKQHGARVASAR
jgi:tetratricopeptide (TPR) repeat protein